MAQVIYCEDCEVTAFFDDVPSQNWRTIHYGHTKSTVLVGAEADVDVEAARRFINAPTDAEHVEGWRDGYPVDREWDDSCVTLLEEDAS